MAQAFEMVRPGGTIVQIGHHVGDVSLTPARFRSKSVRWLNPLTDVISTGPNADTGELAARMIAADRVSIEEYITHELSGLGSFEEAVEITMNKPDYGAMNPAQILVK
jgi:threonine dehydrogenase-like Zn-dependent dehydrogenase